MFINATSYATAGIRMNLLQFNLAAQQISDPDKVADLRHIVSMKQAEVGIKANVAVLKKANEMQGVFLDLLL